MNNPRTFSANSRDTPSPNAMSPMLLCATYLAAFVPSVQLPKAVAPRTATRVAMLADATAEISTSAVTSEMVGRVVPTSSAPLKRSIHPFGNGKGTRAKDGADDLKLLLGGKGANLAEMAALGLPVPPGFTMTTEVSSTPSPQAAHGRLITCHSLSHALITRTFPCRCARLTTRRVLS